ncbi:MAG TPA: transcriptional regulator FtrA [Steroidobacteraceae bacterium]|nr:transcriptional regulator FtrA [Steroidobacteraceae bacterium]
MPKKSHLVVAVAYENLCTFEFGCTVELFALNRPELNVPWYDFAVCSAERKPITAMGGITLRTPHSLGILDRADTIVIPGWRDADEIPAPALLKRIRQAYSRGARFCTICSGVFVLAAAGILDGRTVTTHWRYADKLAKMYPDIKVNAHALYIDEGQILTSAGSAAGLDMFLHLVRRDYGARIANTVAQRLVIPPHRDGGQAQFIPRPVASDEHRGFAKLLDWVRNNVAKPHTVASLARKAATSNRTLQRKFKETTGLSPIDWLIRERVAVAKELLESSKLSLTRVAEKSGFASAETFRRHFRLQTRLSPSMYRRQFYQARN